MAFYCPDGEMEQALAAAIRSLEQDGRPGLSEQLSVTWICYGLSLRNGSAAEGKGTHWRGEEARYPASVVKLLYLLAAEAWLQRELIEDSPELRRALADMIRDSSNDATGFVVDLLTGTCSGPELPAGPLEQWSQQRQLINRWFDELGWPEWPGNNACQKTWGDGPYGRERQSYGPQLENRNRLSSNLTARVLQAVMAQELLSPAACGRMQELLARSLDQGERAADPENQVDGFLGGGLPEGARLWSKAGWMSQARHDAAYIEVEGKASALVVVLSEGPERAQDETLLPELCRRLLEL
ncbi:class A beta-lactamase-related serine hydrolase [Synechococcus sp. A10-1-5-1]|uniref:serine hydrolase n=1 Tax=Synechococcus sp. A10-1-5-1 TaxID=2936507 RepID=UPI002000E3D0|nr:serine hydrolase [Synechococcus sp. A10-1-5-1]UPM51308.1 class A beta-lactamase-related serine hydrolase [Synechococcus sp. A10-1-5-1]